MIELSQDVIEKANEKSVQIYYQQAIETFNWLSKKNENIRKKAGLLLCFLAAITWFCINAFVDHQQGYRYVFLISAILHYAIAIFVCFKLFLTKTSMNPYYPVQKQDDQKAIYESSPNDLLTTIVKEDTKPAIENAHQLNDELSKSFNIAVIFTLFVGIFEVILCCVI